MDDSRDEDEIAVVAASPYFDADWYAKTYPDAAAAGLTPAVHYVHYGAAMGRDPGPAFSTRGYLTLCPDAWGNPLAHFERLGRAQGIIPHPADLKLADFSAPAAPMINVIVPVFEARDDVERGLTALADARTAAHLSVLVIDDGSGPETAAWLDQSLSTFCRDRVDFRLIRHAENRGYTNAINTGFRASTAPYVVTLNSDTIVTPGWADALIRALKSDPRHGIAGPLSNAASWQNVPELHTGASFAINTLPPGMTPAGMAAHVRAAAQPPLYPQIPFLNGFCMAITRAVLDAVGEMDATAFPTGYGEENDFCMRAGAAGFSLVVADDAYVYHAKSKSFGAQRRKTLSEAGAKALEAKHGSDKTADLLGQTAHNAALAAARTRVVRQLAQKSEVYASAAAAHLLTQKILFLLPVGAGGGGAHSVLQEVAAMRALGVSARVAVGADAHENFGKTYADIPEIETILVPYTGLGDILTHAWDADVVVATLASSVDTLRGIADAYPWVLPGYYAQDYEPFFAEHGTAAHQAAEATYSALPNMQVFAKTDWIAGQIEARQGVPVAKVRPSLDHSVYHPRGRVPSAAVRVTAMIRPGTARRAAPRTMAFLKELSDRYGDQVKVSVFGCDRDDPAWDWLETDFPFAHAGVLDRRNVAKLMRQSDLFLDLSDYQGFGRTALEAMACGATALIPVEGGGAEYAVHGQNALICDPTDFQACHAAMEGVITNSPHLHALQLAALETAAGFTPHRAALSELTVFARALAAHRAIHPKPAQLPPRPKAKPAPKQLKQSQTQANPRSTMRGPAFVGDGLAGAALTLPTGVIPKFTAPDLGLHLHLYYPEMLDEFATALARIPCPFTLYVSTRAEAVTEIKAHLAQALPKARLTVESFPNRGRDIGPFLAGFGSRLRRHGLIGHIHSKASPHNQAKADWRAQLLGTLFGDAASIAATFRLFQENPHLGLVFPEYHPSLADQIHWGTNYPAASKLADRMNIALDKSTLAPFPAGSMFWAKPQALEPLFALTLTFNDFPEEAGQIDGSPAHGIERLLGEITRAQGLTALQIRRGGDGS